MLQCESSQLLNHLSWKLVGQTIVDTLIQLPNIDLVILDLDDLSLSGDRYFDVGLHRCLDALSLAPDGDAGSHRYFYGYKTLANRPDQDLLRQTTVKIAELSADASLIIDRYDPNLTALPFTRYQACLAANICSTISLPIQIDNHPVGVLTLHRLQEFPCWQQQEIEAIEVMANQGKLLISQMLAGAKLQQLAQRETTINRITATIRSSLEPPVMFAAIVKELGETLKVDGCTLSLWTKSDRFVKCVGLYNPHEPQQIVIDSPDWQQATRSSVPITENPILQALLYTKKSVSSADLERQKNLARYELSWHSKARALLIVPLIVDEEIIGSITLRQNDSARQWQQSEIELAEAVAVQAAIAVQQAKLYQTTKTQAEQLRIKEQKVRELNNYLTESVLKRFLPAEIVNKAARGELSLDLTPEPRRVTVLFCDLVDFTTLSSQLEVLTLAEILNEYLEAMTQAVFDRGGTVDKFLGDGLMAMFGAPETLSCPEQAKRAISTAKTMRDYLGQLNQRLQAKSSTTGQIPFLKIRCGIHQGKAVIGMFGGRQRKDYTAVGKVVNIASRLQSVAKPNSILVSETVANCLENINWGQGKDFQLKGIDNNIRAFTVAI